MPPKNMAEHAADQRWFLGEQLRPKLDAAVAGRVHVPFVDTAHFVFCTFLCYVWLVLRVYVRAASGRQRLNALGRGTRSSAM